MFPWLFPEQSAQLARKDEAVSNPLEDDSRWTLIGSRFDNSDLHQMFNEMFEEWVESLPVDNPARLLHHMLPKPPGYDYGTDPRLTVVLGDDGMRGDSQSGQCGLAATVNEMLTCQCGHPYGCHQGGGECGEDECTCERYEGCQ